MQKVDLYRQYARQAIETAEIATSKNEKADLLEIAEAWQQLANSTVSETATHFLPYRHLPN
jgi:hypothetical protein